jgi:hypothetical protein
MTTEIYPSPSPAKELHLTNADREAMAQFQSALDACVHGWHNGNEVVLLQSNIHELFGDMLMQYFERSLTEQVGHPIAFTFSNGNSVRQTFVQMPINANAQLHPQILPNRASPQTQTPQQPATHSNTMSTRMKKAPRPMNCWIIFRDAMHKKLKVENPYLTVQEICKPLMCIQFPRSLLLTFI